MIVSSEKSKIYLPKHEKKKIIEHNRLKDELRLLPKTEKIKLSNHISTNMRRVGKSTENNQMNISKEQNKSGKDNHKDVYKINGNRLFKIGKNGKNKTGNNNNNILWSSSEALSLLSSFDVSFKSFDKI